ncbi:MAG: antibiotic biosynthesis monooxygenase [Pseudomonadota bacterium]
MYIAMNRFKITPGHEDDFESVWRNRDSHLRDVPGFKQFKLLRGPSGKEHTLFASHSIWESEETFVAWTKSEAFRSAHANAGDNREMYLGHPQFEGFQVVIDSDR